MLYCSNKRMPLSLLSLSLLVAMLKKTKTWFKDILSCKIHYLFTLMSLLACMTFFILQNTKEYIFHQSNI